MTEPVACLNCGAAMYGPYCARCGQKQPHTDLTLREFVHEATHELAHWEGKLPATLKALFLKPGLLTLDFLAGRRARWLAPLRLYLICSVAYFLSVPLVEAVTHRSARELAKVTITNSDGSTTLTPEGRKSFDEGLPARLFGAERIERAAAKSTELTHEIDAAFPKAMFVLLPLFALLTNIAWRRTLPLYPAHLYLALHLHAAWFGAFALTTMATIFFTSTTVALIIGATAYPFVLWYGLVTLRRVFNDSWPRTLAKAAAISVVYFVCFFVVSLALLAYGVAMMT